MLGNHNDALDASQDAFIRAWRNIRRFEGGASFYTWYSAILRNVCLDQLKRRKKGKHVELVGEHPDVQMKSNPVLLAEHNEQTERAWNAILELPIRQKDIIIMSHFQGMSYKQIARHLNVPIGTVMSRLHNARKALRDKLAGSRS